LQTHELAEWQLLKHARQWSLGQRLLLKQPQHPSLQQMLPALLSRQQCHRNLQVLRQHLHLRLQQQQPHCWGLLQKALHQLPVLLVQQQQQQQQQQLLLIQCLLLLLLLCALLCALLLPVLLLLWLHHHRHPPGPQCICLQ
jgi:hypothetical protein